MDSELTKMCVGRRVVLIIDKMEVALMGCMRFCECVCAEGVATGIGNVALNVLLLIPIRSSDTNTIELQLIIIS